MTAAQEAHRYQTVTKLMEAEARGKGEVRRARALLQRNDHALRALFPSHYRTQPTEN